MSCTSATPILMSAARAVRSSVRRPALPCSGTSKRDSCLWRAVSRTGRAPGLRGRASECALLDDLVSAIRRGESRSLVLRGEAGIGKTALLEYLIASASDLTVVRAVGVESEMELAYASLHQLCGPLLDRLDAAPGAAAAGAWRSCSG